VNNGYSQKPVLVAFHLELLYIYCVMRNGTRDSILWLLSVLMIGILLSCRGSTASISPTPTISSTSIKSITPERPTATLTPAPPKPTVPVSPSEPPPSLTPSLTPSPTSTQVQAFPPFSGVAPIDMLVGVGSRLRAFDDGSIWLIADESVAIFHADTGTWETLVDDLPGDLIDVDVEGRVWVSSEDGTQIHVWEGSVWISYDQSSGWIPSLDRPVSRKLVSDHLGQVWLATPIDVRRFDGEKWTVFTPDDMGMAPTEFEDRYPSFDVAFIESSEQIWVSTCDWFGPGPNGGRGVRWFENGFWKGATSPVANGCATKVREDDQGNIWVGMDSGLWRYTPDTGQWKQYPTPGILEGWNRFGWVDQLEIDPHGDPWVAMGLCGGASCFGGIAYYHIQNESWIQIGEVDNGFFSYTVFDAEGNIWLFTEAGAFEVEENVPEFFAPLYVWAVAVDVGGDIWLGAYYESMDFLWSQQP
jgi:hypothetical protein